MKHFFYKGKQNLLSEVEPNTFEEHVKIVKKDFSKLLETRNLSFLLGSGCSLGPNGIPTMMQLAKSFYDPDDDTLRSLSENVKKYFCRKIQKLFWLSMALNMQTNLLKAILKSFSVRYIV